MRAQPADLAVMTAAKALCEYVLLVTQSSPKRFRFTFVSRLQNLALEVVEDVYRANDVFIGKGCSPGSPRRRLDFQQVALTDARLIAYLAEMGYQQGCLLGKQYELISRHSAICQKLLGAWINSDKKRLGAEQSASTATAAAPSEGI